MAGTSIGLSLIHGFGGIGKLSSVGVKFGIKTASKGVMYESSDLILKNVVGDSLTSISSKFGNNVLENIASDVFWNGIIFRG